MKTTTFVIFSFLLSVLAHGEENQWYKGNTHTHTLWSDGDDLPEMAADWYKRNGYDFLVLSDHNILSRGERWKTLRAHQAIPVIEKAEKRWGEGHIVSRIHEGQKQVKLMPLDEVRDLLEEPGEFIMIEGIELTSLPGGLAVHSNPMNVDGIAGVDKKSSRTVTEELAHHDHHVHTHEQETGRSVFWQVNHPNYKYSVTGEQLAAVPHLDGVEIMNSSSKCFNLGDASRPSVARIWDIANTLRLKRDGLPPIYGTATDDTHRYHDSDKKLNGPGTAWVMVKSASLDAESISAAMTRGDFYSTTGVILNQLEFDATKRVLNIEVDAIKGVNYSIEFIGSKRNVSLKSETLPAVVDEKGISHPVTDRYLDEGIGQRLKTVEGPKASYVFNGDELFVRAVIHCDAPAHFVYDDGSDYAQKAWTQPIGWKLD